MRTVFRYFWNGGTGDTAVMERAMGYAGDFAGNAERYQKKAEKGMKEEAMAVGAILGAVAFYQGWLG